MPVSISRRKMSDQEKDMLLSIRSKRSRPLWIEFAEAAVPAIVAGSAVGGAVLVAGDCLDLALLGVAYLPLTFALPVAAGVFAGSAWSVIRDHRTAARWKDLIREDLMAGEVEILHFSSASFTCIGTVIGEGPCGANTATPVYRVASNGDVAYVIAGPPMGTFEGIERGFPNSDFDTIRFPRTEILHRVICKGEAIRPLVESTELIVPDSLIQMKKTRLATSTATSTQEPTSTTPPTM